MTPQLFKKKKREWAKSPASEWKGVIYGDIASYSTRTRDHKILKSKYKTSTAHLRQTM